MIRRAFQLILKRASASRPSGEWNDDRFDVLAGGVVVGRIMKAAAVPVDVHARLRSFRRTRRLRGDARSRATGRHEPRGGFQLVTERIRAPRDRQI
jgi:hypothetical protein